MLTVTCEKGHKNTFVIGPLVTPTFKDRVLSGYKCFKCNSKAVEVEITDKITEGLLS